MAQEFWKNLSITLTASLSVQAFKPTSLIFPIVYLAVMVFVCLKQVDFSHSKKFSQIAGSTFFFLLILPFLFAVVRPFDGEVLGFFGEIISPVVPLLSLVPLMIAIGTLGPLLAFYWVLLLFGSNLGTGARPLCRPFLPWHEPVICHPYQRNTRGHE
jgi:hypothetical protein